MVCVVVGLWVLGLICGVGYGAVSNGGGSGVGYGFWWVCGGGSSVWCGTMKKRKIWCFGFCLGFEKYEDITMQ